MRLVQPRPQSYYYFVVHPELPRVCPKEASGVQGAGRSDGENGADPPVDGVCPD